MAIEINSTGIWFGCDDESIHWCYGLNGSWYKTGIWIYQRGLTYGKYIGELEWK